MLTAEATLFFSRLPKRRPPSNVFQRLAGRNLGIGISTFVGFSTGHSYPVRGHAALAWPGLPRTALAAEASLFFSRLPKATAPLRRFPAPRRVQPYWPWHLHLCGL